VEKGNDDLMRDAFADLTKQEKIEMINYALNFIPDEASASVVNGSLSYACGFDCWNYIWGN